MKVTWLMCVMLAACIAGYFSKPDEARAAIPGPCPRYACKEVYSWWDGNLLTVNAAWAPGGIVVSTQAIDKLFTPTSAFNGPGFQVAPVTFINVYTYTMCTPLCGKDGTPAQWQAPQQVAPAGMRGPVFNAIPQRTCVALLFGQNVGDQDPTANANTNPPPGVSDNENNPGGDLGD